MDHLRWAGNARALLSSLTRKKDSIISAAVVWRMRVRVRGASARRAGAVAREGGAPLFLGTR